MPATAAPSGVDEVLLAAPRGFCAGVEMAIKSLAWLVKVFNPPVFCYHEIVHNALVVDRFRALGVEFVDDIADVPLGSPIMLSAHGSAPEVVAAARAAGSIVINAVCPLVTKVHHEVKVRAGKGYDIIYVGHHGHDEAVGTMAVAPDNVRLVETPADVAALDLPPDQPVAFLAQTTLSLDEWSDVLGAAKERYPQLWQPGRSDLCYATTNRQAAVKVIATKAQAIVVIGSANSSNTVALAKVAAAMGCPRVVRVNGPDELPDDLSGTVGVTAGASAPEDLVQAVLEALAPARGTTLVNVLDEDEYFPPPPELRRLIDGVTSLLTGASGVVPPNASVLADDRQRLASDVLAGLATR